MATKKEVAEWMYQELMRDGYLSQERARYIIIQQFDPKFVKGEKIAMTVLMEWRNLTRGKVIWDGAELQWRLIKGIDKTG